MSTDRISVLDERYALEKVLGSGGMADVYRATDLLLGRTVAVKLLRETAAAGPERARFEDEVRTLAGLNHPNLTTVLDAGISGAQPYLVMELVEGTSLAESCSGVRMDPEVVAGIGVQVAEALAYAHAAGVVHRDVKPANVLLSPEGRAVLTDFGIARLLSQTSGHTRAGATIGSPPYLAPEQVRGEPSSTAVDLYSFGLVLLEALTGQRAYPGPPTEAALARLTTPPAIPADLPSPWPDLLAAMTRLDPAARPTAGEVATRLRERAFAAGVRAPGAEAAQTRVLGQPDLPPSTQRDLRLPQLAVIAVLLTAAVLMFVLAAASRTEDTGSGGPDIPSEVPSRLQDPLADLHDAVNGGER